MNLKQVTEIAFNTLTRREKYRILAAFILQASLSALELFGVLLFSILANLIVTQNIYVQNRYLNVLFFKTLSFDELTTTKQIAFLGTLVIAIFVFRTVFTALYLQKLSFFLVRKSVETQGKVLRLLLENSTLKMSKDNKQEMQLIITRGISTLYSRNIGGLLSIASDLILVVAVVAGLLVFDTTLMLIVILMFATTVVIIGRMTRRYIARNAADEKEGEVAAKLGVYEILDNYKDFYFNSNHVETIKRVKLPLLKQGLSATKLAFIPVFNRYLSEALLLLMIFFLSAIVLSRFEIRVALSVLATFVLGLSRLIPAILRIQQQVQNMRMSFPFGRSAAKLIAQIDTAASNQQESSSARSFLGKIGVLKLHKVSFSFEANVPILFDVCAEFRTNQSTVIVGASGAGKTTLIDIISGIRVPAKGNVTWSGVELNSLANTGELKIGYVSQDVKLFNGSLKENILMDRRQVTDEQYRQAIKICELDEIILRLEDGENTRLGDGQRLLSGGEIQRIGIARAIIVRPHILILDEFTSNLDMNAEKKILGNLLDNMKSDTIIISIAHRISAIKKFDRVIELSTGRIFFDGSTESWLKIHNKANL